MAEGLYACVVNTSWKEILYSISKYSSTQDETYLNVSKMATSPCINIADYINTCDKKTELNAVYL